MNRLTWSDLLIDNITPAECQEWLAHWSRLVSGQLYPEFLHKFGSWFLHRPEGFVEMLDVLNGEVVRVADSHEEFRARVNDRAWQEDYLLSEVVYSLHQAGKVAGPRQCYAIAPHPMLGGPNPTAGQQIDPQFVMIMDINVWQSLCSQFVQA
jgi:hypothetical protein